MTDREAYIILNIISGIGPARVKSLCEHFGSVSNILGAPKKELLAVNGIGETLAEAVVSWRTDTDYESEMKLAERAGVEIVTLADDKYPSILKEVHDAPLCIYSRGRFPSDGEFMLGVVGSRRITNYGKAMAEHLSRSAVYAGWTVVSGLAYGTDAVAHKTVVDAGGRTIAVLGGGLARIFPQDHIPLAKSIIEGGGAVISEFPMEFAPNRRSFPMRNRIISGLSKGVLVIEAGSSSGALITAKFALEQNRLIFSVPGEASNPQARGCNALIKQGAKLTENFEDIMEEFEFLPEFSPPRNLKVIDGDGVKDESDFAALKLDEDECRIIGLLKNGDASADSLAGETGISTGKLLSLLMKMEMKKLITQLPGKRFSLRSNK
ncbi:MAG: DNA protecting protein DprA [Lentisphaerae bacterium GWF2_50_93]|nr:MAG: DNA protecting protein DprA [Lentisphaerae bacterium GWF2_50_93]